MNRRDFLSTSLAAAGALSICPPFSGTTAAQAAEGPFAAAVAPQVFSADRFRQLVGSRFTLERTGASESVTLAEVFDGPRCPGFEQFTTVFTAKGASPVAPGLYKVRHPELGLFELRLDRSEREAQCNAAFNLLI